MLSIAAQKGISNIKTIESDCDTGLPDNYVDVILLYDSFHNLSLPDDVLRELHRVLKGDGTLSFSDHHMNEQDILTRVTKTTLFKLSTQGKKTYSFLPSRPTGPMPRATARQSRQRQKSRQTSHLTLSLNFIAFYSGYGKLLPILS